MAISGAQRVQIPEVIKKIKTKSEIETKIVVEIKTLLDTITITLQYRREDN